MATVIPYSTQSIDENDVRAVRDVLHSPYLTTGPAVDAFESEMCSYVQASCAVAVSSCTAALHLAMLALGVGPGDLVYVSAVSFAASANCARYVGAEVEFVDVDPLGGNMDMQALRRMLEAARARGRLPKAVVAVHLSGRVCDLRELAALKAEFGFFLIEDAAHAVGSVYCGEKAGCCRFSEITVFSFHPVKIITTAEGGMCLTNDPELDRRLRLLRSHGVERDPQRLLRRDMPAYYYEMRDLGFNYRMSDLQAALGRSQLARIDDLLRERREQAQRYFELFSDCAPLGLPEPDSADSVSSWHLYQVRVPGGRRDEIFNQMRAKRIGVQVHYIPIYAHPYYQGLRKYPPLPGAEAFFKATLSIPLYPGLSTLNQQFVAASLMSLIERA